MKRKSYPNRENRERKLYHKIVECWADDNEGPSLMDKQFLGENKEKQQQQQKAN